MELQNKVMIYMLALLAAFYAGSTLRDKPVISPPCEDEPAEVQRAYRTTTKTLKENFYQQMDLYVRNSRFNLKEFYNAEDGQIDALRQMLRARIKTDEEILNIFKANDFYKDAPIEQRLDLEHQLGLLEMATTK